MEGEIFFFIKLKSNLSKAFLFWCGGMDDDDKQQQRVPSLKTLACNAINLQLRKHGIPTACHFQEDVPLTRTFSDLSVLVSGVKIKGRLFELSSQLTKTLYSTKSEAEVLQIGNLLMTVDDPPEHPPLSFPISTLMHQGKPFTLHFNLEGSLAFWMNISIDPANLWKTSIRGRAVPRRAALTEVSEDKDFATLRWDAEDELWWWFQITIEK